MGIKQIEYGSLASSSDINGNFDFVLEQINNLSEIINTRTASFNSSVATLNTSVQDILGYRSSFLQVGMILPSLAQGIPDGFLLCDGREVLVEEYPDLYEVIGTKFGSSDSTKFALPDLRDKTLFGAGNYNLGSSLTSKLPNIKGQFRLQGTEGSSAVSGAFSMGAKGGSDGHGHSGGAVNPLVQFDASKYNEIYSDDVDMVIPPSVVVKFLIKY